MSRSPGKWSDPSLDPRSAWRYISEPDAIFQFERFTHGYLAVQDQFTFHLMSRLEYQPIAGGFLSSPFDYYLLSEHMLQLHAISSDRTSTSCVFTYTNAETLRGVSPHPHTPGVFALSTSSSLIILRTGSPDLVQEIPVAPDLIGCGWLCDGARIFCASANSGVFLISTDGESAFRAELPSQARRLIVHPTEPAAIVYDQSHLTYFDFRGPHGIRTEVLEKEPLCAAFLPNGLFGVLVGYVDGVIELLSLDGCRSVIRQPGLVEKAVLSIAFCPTREGAIAFSAGSDVLFASLPQWGFGHFVVRNRYVLHLAQVGIITWGHSGDVNWLMSIDADKMCHIFEVPPEFTALSQAPITG